MSSFKAFPEAFDPEETKEYTFVFRLDSGESIVTADIDVVDEDSSATVTSDLTINSIAPGAMDESGLWGVTFWPSGGTDGETYYLRCRITTDASPIPRSFDRTLRLLVKQL